MEKKITLRERYDQINKLLLEATPQREEFENATINLKQKSKAYNICAEIMQKLKKISVVADRDSDLFYRNLTISNKFTIYFFKTPIKETEKSELQKILDDYSPEKVKIVKIVEGDLSCYGKPYSIEVELV